MIAAVDEFLLQRIYIPVSQWAGARFGATAGSLALGCIPPIVVFHLLRIAAEWDTFTPTKATVAVVFNLILVTLFYVQAHWADGVPNRFALEPPLLRTVWVFAAVIIVSPPWHGWASALLAAAREVAVVSYIYFRACPPPPPKRLRRERLAWSGAT